MKKILLALSLAGFAACTSTASVSDSSADATDADAAAKPECCAGEDMAAGCDTTKAAACEAEGAKTCPVTGKTIN